MFCEKSVLGLRCMESQWRKERYACVRIRAHALRMRAYPRACVTHACVYVRAHARVYARAHYAWLRIRADACVYALTRFACVRIRARARVRIRARACLYVRTRVCTCACVRIRAQGCVYARARPYTRACCARARAYTRSRLRTRAHASPEYARKMGVRHARVRRARACVHRTSYVASQFMCVHFLRDLQTHAQRRAAEDSHATSVYVRPRCVARLLRGCVVRVCAC